jgi:hypothetical protein
MHLSDSAIWTWLVYDGLRWKRQQTWSPQCSVAGPGFGEMGSVIQARVAPPTATRVICIDERGRSRSRPIRGRSGKRAGDTLATSPTTGAASRGVGPRRFRTGHGTGLHPDHREAGQPRSHPADRAGGPAVPLRSLASHRRQSIHRQSVHPHQQTDTAGPNGAVRGPGATPFKGYSFRRRLLPTYAPRLNLIQPWLKQLQSLALKGRWFVSTQEREQALWSRRHAELLPIGMLTRAPQ